MKGEIHMAKTKGDIEFKRVNLNLPVHIIEKVKTYANELGINSTSAYIVLLNQALDQRATVDFLPLLGTMYADARNAGLFETQKEEITQKLIGKE